MSGLVWSVLDIFYYLSSSYPLNNALSFFIFTKARLLVLKKVYYQWHSLESLTEMGLIANKLVSKPVCIHYNVQKPSGHASTSEINMCAAIIM